ncbi:3-ketoacyl-ACP reductase [Listeria floridensis FSL S10-1187]|uniref:3-ketoacyl-ACP reductase n=1 Tax=Listeria floridensis FSL S10-1187 TaxID=1265817 RepID=A0ABN0RF83_9LIST|nr:SDR family oxidoreductase [Listeria floridensis]EUJ31825.1 3-ketoacyl-ACP reductase [Listeria floridensis FSL S10-1187]
MVKKKRSAFISGASGAIGRAIAIELAGAGYDLYLHYNTNEEKIRELLAELCSFQVDAVGLQGDFSDPSNLEKITSQVFELDVFIHAAGNSEYSLFEDTTDEQIQTLYDIHVGAPLYLLRKFLPKLRRSESGRILFISSIWGEVGAAMEVAYSTMKGAQIAFVKALSKETAGNGITVNCLTPGAVDTEMLDRFSEQEKLELASEIPLLRLGKPADIAHAALFLISDQAAFMTGQILGVNGGWHM